MSEFSKPIARVYRLLRMQRFLGALVWCWAAALLVGAIVIAVDKLSPLSLPTASWVPLAAGAGVGLVLAGIYSLIGGPSRIDAAVAIDRAFGLNDRLGTALTLPADLLETPAGRALLADTRRHIDGLDIGSKFGLKVPRRAWIPLIPVALAAVLHFVPELGSSKAQAESEVVLAKQENVTKNAKILNARLAEKRKELEKSKFGESEKLLAQVEKAAQDLEKAPPAEKQKALSTLNKLTDALKDRQKQVGTADQISKKLQQLKQMSSNGPADEFARELAKGDFQKAAEQMKKLQEKVMSGKMSDQDKKQLSQQLDQMKKQIEKVANLEDRKKQLEEAKKSGAISKEQFDQQMAKLNDQAADLQRMQKMAQQLAEAQQQMSQGDMQKAAEALGMTQQQLSQMARELSEMESLDSALADLQMAKDGMTGGEGFNQVGDRLSNLGNGMMGMGDGDGQGSGLGRGRGQGDRPIAEDSTATYNTKVKQQMGRGKAIMEGFGPPGAQQSGEALVEDSATIETAAGAAAEALSNQKVPKSVRKHVQSYFDDFRRIDGR